MSASTLSLFALITLVTAATPGPTVLLALRNGSLHGFRLAAFGIAGALLSDALLITAAALGLGALLAASEQAFTLLKWAGVAYLAYLGLGLLLVNRPSTAMQEAAAATGPAPAGRAVFVKSLLVALSNPKGLLFFSALLPQFVSAQAPQGPQYLALALTFIAIDAVVMAAYALLGERALGRLGSAGTRTLDRICGGTLLALSASLAAYRRST